MNDYIVVLSPGESYQTRWLVLDAPNASEAIQMVWTEKRYNSGEWVRTAPVSSREAAVKSADHIISYDRVRVEASRELVRYND